ncbi:MAG: hypothetical protein Q4F95_01115 [Oscillospiraceae bacterium]|nr:hypothetical protein [Oscillospiraceae bacterium]
MENGENSTEYSVDPNVIGKTTDEYIDSKIEDAKDNVKGNVEDHVKEMIIDKLDESAEKFGFGKEEQDVTLLLLTGGASDQYIKTETVDKSKIMETLPSDIADKYSQAMDTIEKIKEGRKIYNNLVALENSINEDGTTSADYEENLLNTLDDFVGVAGSLADKIPGGKYYSESFGFAVSGVRNLNELISKEHSIEITDAMIFDTLGTDIESKVQDMCQGNWKQGPNVYETAAWIKSLESDPLLKIQNQNMINELNKYLTWRTEYEFALELEAQGLTLESYNYAMEQAKKAAEREEKSKTVIGQMQLDVEDAIDSFAVKVYTSDAWMKSMAAANKLITGFDDFKRNMFDALELYKIYLDYKWNEAEDKLLDLYEDAEKKAVSLMIESWTRAINAVQRVFFDPLILDLNGNGFEINSKSSGTYFDLNSDGFAEKINWTSKDAILAVDLNEDEKINNGREVFGDYHLLADGTRASNGFEALAQYDTNKDGIIDENDEIFGKLRLWVDSDNDGKSAASELKTLAEMNISAIRLDYEEINQQTDSEAVIGNAATFIYKDNTQGNIAEMWVSSDFIDTQEVADVELSDEIKSMADVSGHGKLYSLHTAMSLDTTGTLKNMVDQFDLQTQSGQRRAIVENILAYMCKCDEISDRSRGGNISARKLAVVEAYMGESFVGRNGENPNNTAGPILDTMYNKIVDVYYYSLVGQMYSDIMDLIIFKDNNGNTSVDTTVFNIFLKSSLKSGEMSNDKLSEICGYLKYMAVNSDLNSKLVLDTREFLIKDVPEYTEIIDKALNIITAKEDNGSINGTLSDDIMIGSSSDDILSSSDGNDILNGGTGNDILNGGAGTDRYIYGIGDATDIINDSELGAQARNIIEFREGITPEDLYIYRTGNYDLTIQVGKNEDDKITISNFVYDESHRRFMLKFADESEAELRELAKTLLGTESGDTLNAIFNQEKNTLNGLGGDDTLNAGNGDDILIGGAGNDILNSGNGNDILDGGTGNDTLNGGNGQDTYIYGIGDGTDILNDYESDAQARNILEFREGITPEDLYIYRTGNYDLTIQVGENEDDKITISNFVYDESHRRFMLKFADESEAELRESAKTLIGTEDDNTLNAIYNQEKNTLNGLGGNDTLNSGNGDDMLIGGAGNDILNSGNGNDILDGGTGNDTLNGGNGQDTYIYGIGDGTDIINEYESGADARNILEFREGITLDDLYIYRTGNYDLTIQVGENEDDKITISNFVYSDTYEKFKLKFADESEAELKELAKTIVGTESADTLNAIYTTENILNGLGGNDTLNSGNGKDILIGGAGNDILNAGNGNDILEGGTGNDTLNGGNGQDTYIYGIGDGTDIINEYESGSEARNILEFKKGITPEDLYIYRTGNYDLTIQVGKNEDDKITISNFVYDESHRRFMLKFADESEAELRELAKTLLGTESGDTLNAIFNQEKNTLNGLGGDDTLNAGNGDDILIGGAGKDILNSGNGSDILEGGTGNDTLNGGNGQDTYIYGIGDGTDIINEYESGAQARNILEFREGITLDDLYIYRTGNYDLTIQVGENEDDKIRISNFVYDESYRRFRLKFADESEAELRELAKTLIGTDDDNTLNAIYNQEVNTLNGLGGNDTLNSGNGDDMLIGGAGKDILNSGNGSDILEGGTGNDTLNGGNGQDTYIYGIGDGTDIINEYESGAQARNILEFREGITPDDLYIYRSGNYDLTIQVGENEDDKIRISNFVYDESYRRFRLKFADESEAELRELAKTLIGTDDDNTLNAIYNQEVNTLNGLGGNDTLNSGNGDDMLIGGAGKDILNSGNGSDILEGGTGNDTLNGGNGQDTYIYGIGDGTDIINEYESGAQARNILEFREGITPDDLYIYRSGNYDLTIQVGENEDDKIRISNFVYDESYRRFRLKFADESEAELRELAKTLIGTDDDNTLNAIYNQEVNTLNGLGGNDTLNSGNGDDMLIGGAGKDILNSGNGSDILEGGTGNDTLNGGNGQDTYIYGIGDGTDIINEYESGADARNILEFREGITLDDLHIYRSGNYNLTIQVGESEDDRITISDFAYSDAYKKFKLKFADESEAELRELAKTLIGTDDDNVLNAIYNQEQNTLSGLGGDDTLNAGNGDDILIGGAGNDTLNAGNGNDILDGGTGNDTLNGGNGQDTYIYGIGYGTDLINDYESSAIVNNIIKFEEEISASDIKVSAVGNYNLQLSVGEDSNDKIILSDYRYSGSYQHYELQFADGTTGTVNSEYNGLDLVIQQSEEDIFDDQTQAGAEVIQEAYDNQYIQDSAVTTQAPHTVITEPAATQIVNEDSSAVSDMTDIQAMILTENMSAFAANDNISDSITSSELTDSTQTNQLFSSAK